MIALDVGVGGWLWGLSISFCSFFHLFEMYSFFVADLLEKVPALKSALNKLRPGKAQNHKSRANKQRYEDGDAALIPWCKWRGWWCRFRFRWLWSGKYKSEKSWKPEWVPCIWNYERHIQVTKNTLSPRGRRAQKNTCLEHVKGTCKICIYFTNNTEFYTLCIYKGVHLPSRRLYHHIHHQDK